MDNEEELLKKIYQSSIFRARQTAARENCLHEADILAFFDRRTSRRRKLKTIDHLTECPDCALLFKFLIETERETSLMVEKHFRRQLNSSPGKAKRSIPLLSTLPLRAISAAAVILTVVITFAIIKLPEKRGGEGHRGTPPEVLLHKPAGRVIYGQKLSFSWENIPGADSYLVEVFDENLSLVWKSDRVLGNCLVLPGSLMSMCSGTKICYWKVSAFRQNQKAAESDLMIFNLTEKRP